MELVGIISIRELTRAYELLQHEANTDALTGLSNRRQFFRTLDNVFDLYHRYGRPFSVAMIDVDSFKSVNDSFGHEAGDKVLTTLADLLVCEFHSSDCIGRIGGEEFAVIFSETDLDGAKLACDRLFGKIRNAVVVVDGAEIRFTVSIGLTAANPDSLEPASLLRRADMLLYDAKAAGKNQIQVDLGQGQPCLQADQERSAIPKSRKMIGRC